MRRRRPRGGAPFRARAASVFLWCACLASAAGGDETSSASGTPKSAPTLLVSFDGFRASYLDAQDPSSLPELTAMWRGGVRAALRPRFISKTFPNHYTLVTGLNEQTHGIVANRFFDPDANNSFSPASNASFWWDGGEPLWVTAVRDGRDARVYFWPGSESEIRGFRPTEYRAYEKTQSFDARVDAVAKWVLDAVENKNHSKHPFFAVYFEEPDASGHVHGPHAEETKAAARRVDDALLRLRVAVGDSAWNALNVVVVADHGMAELDKNRAVFLADEPCGVPFHDLHIEGSDVVMHVWPRTSATRNDASGESFPVDPADPSAAWFDANALAAKVNACHEHVSAWTRESVPKRFAYGGNRRVGPVVIAADVGWTLCGANASFSDAGFSGESVSGSNATEYAHERDWSAEHSGCVSSLAKPAGHRGAHGFDNDAKEMRAVFIARGPSFRKDGARLLVAESHNGDGEVTAATGRDADVDVYADDASDFDAVAAAWESKTYVFDNTAIFAIAARALGMDVDDDSLVLADGAPFPNVDDLPGIRMTLRDALFDFGGEEKDEDTQNAVVSAVLFLAAAFASFAAFTLVDRRLTGRWPFERARAALPEMDAEQQLPEMELVGVQG